MLVKICKYTEIENEQIEIEFKILFLKTGKYDLPIILDYIESTNIKEMKPIKIHVYK